MVQLVITSLSRSEGPRFEPGWNHTFCVCLSYFLVFFFSYLTFLIFLLKKQRREVSINRPASYEPAALPLRHPAFLLPSSFCPLNLVIFPPFFKKLHRRESNPGHKRERLVCYQLHHNGLYLLTYLSLLSSSCFLIPLSFFDLRVVTFYFSHLYT